MGGAVLAALKFVAAVFGFASAGQGLYWVGVQVARIAVLAYSAKALTPKVDLSQTAQEKQLTIRDSIYPQAFVYGQDSLSGPMFVANTTGTDNTNLTMGIALTGHELADIVSFRIDDIDIPLTDINSSTYVGQVDQGHFANAAIVEAQLGSSTQTQNSLLDTAFGSLWTTAHRARGWSVMAWQFILKQDDNTFDTGAPQNIRAVVKGYKVYDPRLDSTQTAIPGAGTHRVNDPSTWEWSDNPALCLGHFIIDTKFGMAEDTDRVDWVMVATAADVCEEQVEIPPGATFQNRYTCNATFRSDEQRGSVRDALLQAMMGRMVFSQGVWKIWAGEAITPDVTLDEANLAGEIVVQASASAKERYNRVRGKFIDPSRDYTASTYPEQRSSTYETADGGEVRSLVLDFLATNNEYEAQRKAIIALKQSRQQRVVSFQGNMSCFRIQPGTTVLLDCSEYGFTGEKFFVTEWELNDSGVRLTLVEEIDASWADPAVGDYSTRSATGTLTFANQGVPAPTALAATAYREAVKLTWTAPPNLMYAAVEVWASYDNDRNNAVLVTTVPKPITDAYDFTAEFDRLRYYWCRAVNETGTVSAWHPNLTTTTVQAYNEKRENAIVQDEFIRLGASYWSLGSNCSYVVGGGLNGTDAISVHGGSGLTQQTFIPVLRRGPLWDVEAVEGMAVEIRIRYKVHDAHGWTGADNIQCFLEVTDADGSSNQQLYGTFDIGVTDGLEVGVWKTATKTLVIGAAEASETPPRYLRVQLRCGPYATFHPLIYFDEVHATIQSGQFKDDGAPGLVPDASAASDGTVLASDGAWRTSNYSPINVQNGSYAIVASDAGKTIRKESGGAGETYTIPANASVPFEVGTLIGFDNEGGGDLTIAITTDTLVGTDGATGSRTLGDGHRAVAQKVATTRWRYSASDL